MFRETLLESAPSGRKRKRWPMTMAFTAELVVAGLLVMLPLLSTGVISVSAHVPLVAPLGRSNPPKQNPAAHPSAGGIIHVGHPVILPIAHACVICGRRVAPERADDSSLGPPTDIGMPDGLPHVLTDSETGRMPPAPQPARRIRVSVLSEAQLVNRVDPVYPRIAVITHTQGEVRLHAIIAKDGTIQSLSVISGPPLLAGAARDAVSQWRYRPYFLNGEAVEVETFITVSFKGIRD